MNYYMIVTNEIDYEWDVDNQFVCAGFTDRNKKSVKAMETSDKIIYYVTKHSKFMASVEVSGVYFYSEEPVWDDLEFIKNKTKWGSQVQGNFRKLSEHDYNVIANEIRKRIENE